MNILLLSWRGPGHPNAGGAEQVTLEYAKAWVNAGHEVTLFTSSFTGAIKTEQIAGVKIIRQGGQVLGVKIKALIWYLVKKHPKFDLVIDEFHGIPFFTILYIRAVRLAFIHEVARDVWKYNPWPKPFKFIPTSVGTLSEPLLFRFLYKKVPFMTVSESTKKDLIAWGIPSKNITVIHNGVKLFAPNKLISKEIKKTALYLGAISEDKGIFDAIKVFSEINRKDEDWQFWVVGPASKELLKRIKSEVRYSNIENNFKYWGFVSDKKKFELLARAHILVNPSVHEGWGLVNIEANSVGIPVVGYNVHGLRDSVRNNETGILVEPRDFRSLAENVLKLVNDKERYLKFQKKAKAWSTKFSWEKSTKESLELIESL